MNRESEKSRTEKIRSAVEKVVGVLFWLSLLFGVGAVGTLDFESGKGPIAEELLGREAVKVLVSGIVMVISLAICYKCGKSEQ